MKCNEYRALEEAIRLGVAYGVRRAVKYQDFSEEINLFLENESNQDVICSEVMTEICEWFSFTDSETSDPLGYLLILRLPRRPLRWRVFTDPPPPGLLLVQA